MERITEYLEQIDDFYQWAYLLPRDQWQFPEESARVELQLQCLTTEQWETVLFADRMDCEKLVEELGLQDCLTFLDSIFLGENWDCFFLPKKI